MDPPEDLSARVLLRHILTTEPPRTPITRSASIAQSSSGTRQSSRLKNKNDETPQELLRRSLKHKMRESITRTSLPAPKRRTTSAMPKKINTPAATSVLLNDGDTPRHMLMNILRTEPVRSPVVHTRAASERLQETTENYSTSSKRPSIELSGLDLPDVTIGNAASIAKGLSRKRPRRSLNVTAFEKRLRDGDGDGEDVTEEIEDSMDDHSSLSLSSSTSLSLKTPFVDIRTEKRGLQRRVSNRRKITEEEFGAAVNKRQMGGVSSFVMPERGLSDTTHSEGFTLGLSQFSEPDITADIVNCKTALYADADAMTANFSVVATQDKPTIMASQLQMEQDEHSELRKEESMFAFPTELKAPAESQNEETSSQSEEDVDAVKSQDEEQKSTAEHCAAIFQPDGEEGAGDFPALSEEVEDRNEAQTEEEGDADFQMEEDATVRSQSEEEEVISDSQTKDEEEDAADSEEENVIEEAEEDASEEAEEEKVEEEAEEDAADSEEEQVEEDAADSEQEKIEEEAEEDADSQHEEAIEAVSQSEEEDVSPDSQTEDEGAVDSQPGKEGDHVELDPADGGLTDSHPEDEPDGELEVEEQLQHDIEHISRRAHRSEGGLLLPVRNTGTSDGKSMAHSAIGLYTSVDTGSLKSDHYLIGAHDLAAALTEGQTEAEEQPGPYKSISLHLSEMTQDGEDHRPLSDDSPEDAVDEEPAQEEEEWEEEDEENDDVPSKTPAFVRQKINFYNPDPLASPTVLKDIQSSSTSKSEGLPGSKPKQVRKTRTGSAKKEGALPKSYLMGVFKHFAKTKVSADVYPVLQETMDKFFERMADDLETYAVHAKRKTIEVEDVVLLLKRQGHVTDKVPVEVLIEKYLRMDQRRLLIPIATSGNVVIPKKRR